MSEGCSGNCSSCSSCEDPIKKIQRNLEKVRCKIAVMSGKGGVGKSTVAVNTAMALALAGKKVGLIDADIHGPSIPTMLKVNGAHIFGDGEKIQPIQIGELKVISIAFFLEEVDAPVIARGPMKIGLIQQFLSDVDWGELDYLIIDLPPGTGDEPLTVCQMLPDATGAIIVTTPQKVAAADVSKSINFCSQIQMPVLGIIENMSGYACPHCGKIEPLFASGAGQELAEKFKVPFLGKIPLDPVVCRGGDDGQPFVQYYRKAAATAAFETAIEPILALTINA